MLNHPRILVADADPGICRLLRRHFGTVAYSVVTAETGREALDLIRRTPPDLAILSTDLDDFDGPELIRRVRSQCGAPIIALMRVGGPLTPTQVLDSGADDCIDEPFLLKELAARVRRLLQRVGAWQGPSVLATGLGPIEVDPLERKVRIAGKLVALTRKEFDLLSLLVGAKGGTLSHDEIVHRVWGRAYSGARQNLRRTVSSLRHKVEPDAAHPAHIISVRGSGYRLRVRPGANADAEVSASTAVDTPVSGTRSR
jgi:two-component system KDP operon response regulator KdpE